VAFTGMPVFLGHTPREELELYRRNGCPLLYRAAPDKDPTMPMSLFDELFYSAVKLNCMCAGEWAGSGTGFFWTTPLAGEREATFLVTNKHVVLGFDAIRARCHVLDQTGGEPSGAVAECEINVAGGPAWQHPDPAVDLCAIALGPILNQAIQNGQPLFVKSIRGENIPSTADWDQFDSIEDVLMIGCPNGIYDEVNNLPITRRGITATPLGKRYEGRDEFMVDMACFPGSSGSPVFIASTSYFDRARMTHVIGGRFFFVGILYAGPQVTQGGAIVLGQQPRVEVAAMMHLGQVMRSTALRELDAEVQKHHGAPNAA
jgi:hypothetical protein